MAPIRTAIIGLSSSAMSGWASNAHLPYLLSARGREKFQIVALLNSSVEAARRAAEAYKLGPSTKAYGDPQALADDPDVDFVVDATRVDVHYPTILPSVKAGKNVFVEWPLASNLAQAKELADAVEAAGSRSMIGLQGRFAPILLKLREVLEQGTIGKILSTEIRAVGGTMHREQLTPGIKYFTDRSIGGNLYTINYGHTFDQVQSVIGDFVDLKGNFTLQRPAVKIRDSATGEIVETVTSDVPDLFITTGSLAASNPLAAKNASVLFRFRRGQPFPGEPVLVWTINGEKGEIRLVAQDSMNLHVSAYNGPVTFQFHDFATDKVEDIKWSWESWQEDLSMTGRIVGSLYDNYADGNTVPSFKDAAVRHEQLDAQIAGWKA